MANQYNNKVVLSNGTTIIDLSTDTVTDASHIMSGKVGHLADGSVVTGTGASESQVVSIEDVPNTTGTTAVITGVAAPEGSISITTNGTHDVTAYEEAIVNVPSQTPTIQPLSVTSNGTYTAPSGVDGYSPVTVNVSGGGGGSSADPNADVIFIDYDGTVLHSYSASEFANLTEMPENPSHAGLVSQGWNWSLADAKAQVAEMGSCEIGQMYITDDGKTRLTCYFPEDKLGNYLTVAINGTVVVDWGDGHSSSEISGSSLSTQKYIGHTYATAGEYVISIEAVSGSFAFYGAIANYGVLRSQASAQASGRRARTMCIKSAFLGIGATLGDYAFCDCGQLETVTLPSSLQGVGTYAFYQCRVLKSVTLPPGVSGALANSVMNACYALAYVSLPAGVTAIGGSCFLSCYSLRRISLQSTTKSIANSSLYRAGIERITVPNGATIAQYAFRNCTQLVSVSFLGSATIPSARTFTECYRLSSFSFPSGATAIADYLLSECRSIVDISIHDSVTSIGNYAFSACMNMVSIHLPDALVSIGNNAFATCSALEQLTIPPSVTSIGQSAFSSMESLSVVHVGASTPPTLGANAFSNSTASPFKIYVPQGSLEAYQTATNWSTYASYMVEEE